MTQVAEGKPQTTGISLGNLNGNRLLRGSAAHATMGAMPAMITMPASNWPCCAVAAMPTMTTPHLPCWAMTPAHAAMPTMAALDSLSAMSCVSLATMPNVSLAAVPSMPLPAMCGTPRGRIPVRCGVARVGLTHNQEQRQHRQQRGAKLEQSSHRVSFQNATGDGYVADHHRNFGGRLWLFLWENAQCRTPALRNRLKNELTSKNYGTGCCRILRKPSCCSMKGRTYSSISSCVLNRLTDGQRWERNGTAKRRKRSVRGLVGSCQMPR